MMNGTRTNCTYSVIINEGKESIIANDSQTASIDNNNVNRSLLEKFPVE